MRAGGEYFLEPAEAVQRRYEALRCYFVEDASAESVGARFGYSPATVHQLAAELRAGRSSFFRSSKPGPKGPRKTHTIRDRVLVLRAADRSVTEIAQALTAQGDAVSVQTVWAILKPEGLERLERRGPAGPAPRLEPVTAKALGAWPTGARYDCDHAGLYLLLPAMVELGLDQLIGAANYPGTKVLSSFHSMASLLMLKCSRRPRAGNAFPLGADPGARPRAGTSGAAQGHPPDQLLLPGPARQQPGPAGRTGPAMPPGRALQRPRRVQPGLPHYPAPRRTGPARGALRRLTLQRTRSVLTFFAQDHASTEMVYANADITKAEQAREVIAFAEYWKRVAGADPGLLVFDSKLTTYPVLDELAARGITFLTLRQRGPKVLEALAALPASAWRTHNVKRAGRYRHPQIHEAIVHLKGIEAPLRQIAIRNIGHDQPTLLITNDLTTPAKDLFTRYAERMIIENELDADISGFHLNALSSGLPLNVDLDTTLTVLAGNCYRLLARKLPRYELATPDRLWRHFLDNTGTVTVADDHVRIDLALRTYTPVLIDAGFPELDIPIGWWGGRSLRPPQVDARSVLRLMPQ